MNRLLQENIARVNMIKEVAINKGITGKRSIITVLSHSRQK
jgi:hypothetical protein